MPVSESDVLLESPAVLAPLLLSMGPACTWRRGGWPGAASPPAPRKEANRTEQAPLRPETEPKRPDRSHPCACGACPRCRDNARWNRIFDEKYADPSYYGRVSIRHNSSLAGV